MEVLNFIRDNWQYISSVIVIIITIIAMLIKRKPVTEVHDDSVISHILDYVIQAEEIFGHGHGADKLDYVKKCLVNSGKDAGLDMSTIEMLVEYVLSSPQKKGVSNEKVK